MKFLVSLLFASSLLASFSALASQHWVLVDTSDRSLMIMKDDEMLERFESVSIGRNGASEARVVNDGTTPLGEFVINRVNQNSRFHLFFGINFPNEDNVKRAYSAGKINFDTFVNIWEYREKTGRYPANSVLGGNIGIHGIGVADPAIHKTGDWTNGCVALTDQQINKIRPYLHLGTRVVIR